MNADWTGPMRGSQVQTPKPCKVWLALYSDRDKNSALSFFKELCDVAKPMGMNWDEPKAYVPNMREIAYYRMS